jgi:CarboxypepD_reg-like domain
MKKLILLFMLLHILINLEAQIILWQVLDTRTKEPLSFMSISIKNTTKGIISKEDGNFSINVQNKDMELIFNSIGYFSHNGSNLFSKKNCCKTINHSFYRNCHHFNPPIERQSSSLVNRSGRFATRFKKGII